MPNKATFPSALLSKVKKEDIDRFKQDYQEVNFVLDVIKEAIEEEYTKLLDQQESELLFQEPGYLEHYAHLMGQRKMAKRIINLFPKKG